MSDSRRWVHVLTSSGAEFIGVQVEHPELIQLDPAYLVAHGVFPAGPGQLAEYSTVRAVPEGIEPVTVHLGHVTPFSALAPYVREGFERGAESAQHQRAQKRAASSGLVLAH